MRISGLRIFQMQRFSAIALLIFLTIHMIVVHYPPFHIDFTRILDPRDSAPAERLEDLIGGDGVYRCHTIFNCIDACPKDLNPTEAIETLRKLAQKRQAFEAARAERQRSLDQPIAAK